jgi:glycosyltransferase involved in cell wall biosynthesis
MGGLDASVVIPVYNGASTLKACLSALATQSFPKDRFEVIVVDDGSTDETLAVARSFGVRAIRQRNRGAPAARNNGISAARGKWVAFTDADCVPSRSWLQRLLKSVSALPNAIGTAGRTMGLDSQSDAARFVDLMGGLDARRNLAHPTFPFAPTANVMYRMECLTRTGGFDERFATYDACDLHTRIRERCGRRAGDVFVYEPTAVVLHRHRNDWRSYWRQQYAYGIGYAQFMLAYHVGWSALKEVRELGRVARAGLAAPWPGRGEDAIVRRGCFIRSSAQHLGFCRTYYDPRERARW